jgi:protein-disulfide isomerase
VTVATALAAAAGADELERRPQSQVVVHAPPGPMPIHGPRLAPVTIELFVNLDQHREARDIHRRLMTLAERHPRRLRVVYRLEAQRGRTRLAEAALEAFAQGVFPAFLEAVLDHGAPPGNDDLARIAGTVGMDWGRLEQAWNDQRYLPVLEDNYLYKKRRRVLRVPELLFNGVSPGKTVRTLGIDDLEALYDDAYEQARAALDRGVPLKDLHRHLIAAAAAAEPPQPILPGLVDGQRGGPEADPPEPRLVTGRIDYRGPHRAGPDDAPVVLVLYCNFKSKICRDFNDAIADIRSAYEGDVRFVFKHLFDETDPDQKGARLLHEASLCADAQGAFWRFYDLAYDRRARSRPDEDDPVALAEAIGVDGNQFLACLSEGRYAERLELERRAGLDAGIRQTPSVVIGGRHYVGTKTFLELRALVEEELRPGLLERATPPWVAR